MNIKVLLHYYLSIMVLHVVNRNYFRFMQKIGDPLFLFEGHFLFIVHQLLIS